MTIVPTTAGFRALVEENVKASVKSIASSSVIKNVCHLLSFSLCY